MAYWVAGIYGLGTGHGERQMHYVNDGVQDEGKKHVLMEGNSLAAETPGREERVRMLG